MTTLSVPAGLLVRTGPERAALVRRTYAIVFVGILCTIAGATFGLAQPWLMQLIARNPLLSVGVALIPLVSATWASDRFPANITLVLVSATAIGVLLAPALYIYGSNKPGLITQAAALAIGAFAALTAFASVSRRDFSAWGSFATVGLWVLVGTALLNLWFRNNAMDLWLAGGTILVLNGLLVFDTWRIRNAYGPDEYVSAAVRLYLAPINGLLALLRVVARRRD